MNVEAATKHIQHALAVSERMTGGWAETITFRLQEALKALQPQRYVLHFGSPHLYILDTQHPLYSEGAIMLLSHRWVLLRWTDPAKEEIEKARAIVEHLNSTATHETTT